MNSTNQWYTTKCVNGWICITTPFLDSHNDCIQLYAMPILARTNIFLISDDLYICTDLKCRDMLLTNKMVKYINAEPDFSINNKWGELLWTIELKDIFSFLNKTVPKIKEILNAEWKE